MSNRKSVLFSRTLTPIRGFMCGRVPVRDRSRARRTDKVSVIAQHWGNCAVEIRRRHTSRRNRVTTVAPTDYMQVRNVPKTLNRFKTRLSVVMKGLPQSNIKQEHHQSSFFVAPIDPLLECRMPFSRRGGAPVPCCAENIDPPTAGLGGNP